MQSAPPHFNYPVTARDIIMNFLRLFECCIGDYRDKSYLDWKVIEAHVTQAQKVTGGDDRSGSVTDLSS